MSLASSNRNERHFQGLKARHIKWIKHDLISNIVPVKWSGRDARIRVTGLLGCDNRRKNMSRHKYTMKVTFRIFKQQNDRKWLETKGRNMLKVGWYQCLRSNHLSHCRILHFNKLNIPFVLFKSKKFSLTIIIVRSLMIHAVKELSVETFNSNSYDIWNSANRIPQCWSYNVKINFARHQHDTEETQNRAGL